MFKANKSVLRLHVDSSIDHQHSTVSEPGWFAEMDKTLKLFSQYFFDNKKKTLLVLY